MQVKTRSGRILTEADLDRLADEAEAGFDPATFRTRPGRPPLDVAAGGHSPRLEVRVPVTLRDRVLARAASEGRSVSDVLRELLEAYAAGAPRPTAPPTQRRPT
jgi:hypothetical protein